MPNKVLINYLLFHSFCWPLLSFAHGSNDVANAMYTLAAIVDVYSSVDHIVHKRSGYSHVGDGGWCIRYFLGLALYGS